MYAWLGDSDQAYHYLDYLIKHDRVSPTTMYAEGNPVIESPLSFATCIHDMLLQSWGGVLRVFPAAPKLWGDVAFKDLRGQGAFLVSAKKQAGVTQFVMVKSLIGSPCVVWTDIPNPKITIDGSPADFKVREDGSYEVPLKKGETVIFVPAALGQVDLTIKPIPVAEADRNLFGLNEKTTRLPGHQHYYKESTATTSQKPPTASKQKLVKRESLPAGRYVRIELPGNQRILSLAEVEVFAGGKNVAINRKATQSTTVYGGVPERAVDGNTDGDYNNRVGDPYRPDGTNPWWEVDLGTGVED